MFNSTILDVAIGLAFTYLLLALVCTTINEWIAGISKTRGKMLLAGIKGMLGEQKTASGANFFDAFWGHSTIAAFRQKPSVPPSYLPSRAFATAVMDLVTPPGAITFDSLENGLKSLPDGCVKSSLLASIQTAPGDLDKAQAGIEGWFNDTMDRVSGWFTRRKQWMSAALAIGLAIAVNADTLSIANKLWINPVLRDQIVKQAEANKEDLRTLVTAHYPDPKNPRVTKPTVEIPGNPEAAKTTQLSNQLGDLVGWRSDYNAAKRDVGSLVGNSYKHLPGWILTAIAVSLGAPFWFDTLNRIMNIRSSGKSPAEGSKGPRKDMSQEAA